MNIYLLGSDSYIANSFYNKTRHQKDCKRVSRNSSIRDYSFDLLNPNSFNFDMIQNKDTILFFAANSSPDSCEKNPESAYQTNVIGTSNFIKRFLEKNARVLFFSSDNVFEGGDKVFYENSERNPSSKYGQMKLSIEKEFEGNKNFKIFRLAYVYSRRDKFSSYLENCAQKKCDVEIYPLSRNVVYLGDLIEGIDNLIPAWDLWDNQTFNICGGELVPRERIARHFKEIISDITIKVVEPTEAFLKARPMIVNMKSDYFSKLLNHNPTPVLEAMLKEYQ